MSDIAELLIKHTNEVETKIKAVTARVEAAEQETKANRYELDDIGQQLAGGRRYSGGGMPDTWGGQVANSDHLNHLAEIKSGTSPRVRFEVKDITSATSPIAPADRDQNWNMLAGRQPRLRQLLTVRNTQSGSVDHVRQSLRDNNAAPQVEGELKAQSGFAWETENQPIRTIAHWTKASVQILDDIPQLQSVIDGELRYGLDIVVEDQILTGDGVSPNLDGLITNATAFAPAFAPAGETMIDKAGLGLLQVANAFYVPNGIVMNPGDWMRMRLLKDADGNYLLGNPQADAEQRLFGIPVVTSAAIPVDKFLVGDFARAATLYDRQEARVEISTEDGDNFRRNMVTIRCECRLALAINNPTALVYGDFGNIA